MRKRLTITKEWLQRLGITDVTENGEITYRGMVRTHYAATTTHKYGKTKVYPTVNIYDPDYFQDQRKRKCKSCAGERPLLVSRITYAWHHGVCPGEFDVDHIDNNPFNNNINNLQLLTRKENLARRVARNQHTATWTEEKILEFRKQRTYYLNEIEHCRKDILQAKAELEVLERRLNVYKEVSKDLEKYKTIIRVKARTENEIIAKKQEISELQKERHYWRNCYKEFLNKYKGE